MSTLGTAELRKVFTETYDFKTGLPEYEVRDTITISENAIDHLFTPKGDESSYFEWVFVGSRADQLSALGIVETVDGIEGIDY